MTVDWMAEAQQRFNALQPAEQKKYEKAWDAVKAAMPEDQHDAAKEHFWQALANGNSAVECKALAIHFDAVTAPPTAEPVEPPKATPAPIPQPEAKHGTREEWLLAAVEEFRPWFVEQAKPLPDTLHVSCGMYGKSGPKTIGLCFSDEAARDKVRNIFVSPALAEPVRVLAVLLHECVHAALPWKTEKGKHVGHTKPFATLAGSLGLVKPWTATTPDEACSKRLAEIGERLGVYPHGALTLLGRKVQTNRHLKCECPACGGIVRATRKYLTTTGAPFCACTGVDAPTRMSNPLTDGDDWGDEGDD